MRSLTAILLMLGLSLAPAKSTFAEEESSGSAELAKVSLGTHWYGPEVNAEDLKGKVTLLVFWGFN